MIAPWLVLAVGNPSRGDDALGPRLLECLRDDGVERAGEVELLTDFQLQLEHALDLESRAGVLFVDAAMPGMLCGASVCPVQAHATIAPASHSLSAAGVLHVAGKLLSRVPPAWQLGIEGESFELGAGLSPGAERNLAAARLMALDWLQAQRAASHEPGAGRK